jgi:peptidoglycan hydrolase-like protein with peptidoglycan-binding domain
MRPFHRAAVFGVTLAGVAATAVVFAGPASATSPCNSTSSITHGSLSFDIPSIGHNSGNVNCHLSVNDNSPAVKSLQIQLNDCYWSGSNTKGHSSAFGTRLSEDGQYGSKTEAAVRAAQSAEHISADGDYGPQTRSHILFFADDGQVGRCARFGA